MSYNHSLKTIDSTGLCHRHHEWRVIGNFMLRMS